MHEEGMGMRDGTRRGLALVPASSQFCQLQRTVALIGWQPVPVTLSLEHMSSEHAVHNVF